jgi:hypothetical protein
MRYPQGGGLTAERRAVRERLRLQAAEGFARGEDNQVIARQLRVSVRSVQRWRKAWKNAAQEIGTYRGNGGEAGHRVGAGQPWLVVPLACH